MLRGLLEFAVAHEGAADQNARAGVVRVFGENAFAVVDRLRRRAGLEALQRRGVHLVGFRDDRFFVHEPFVFTVGRRFGLRDAFDVHDPLAHLRRVDRIGHQAQERFVNFSGFDVAFHGA